MISATTQTETTRELNIRVPVSSPKIKQLYRPSRYKFLYGGRGGSKSWEIARALLLKGVQTRLHILCGREYQKSIKDSVHHLLVGQIDALGLNDYYRITQTSIEGINGTDFIFSGIKTNIRAIKSFEAIDIAWIEEAEKISKESLEILIPTVRKEGSELWFSFNPDLDSDPMWQMVSNPPPDSLIIELNFRDNRFFPDVLKQEMEYCRSIDTETYDWIWEGKCRQISDANIIKRIRVDSFETPKDARFFFGADFGFANDPATLDRMFMRDDRLWIDHAVHKIHCELDDMPAFYDQVPGSRLWPIKADSARPETISYIRRHGFNISAAEKWNGSVEDGIAYLNGFKEIVIHERCTQLDKKCLNPYQETRMYRYKVDPITKEVLPVIVDKHNHHIDSWRYGLDQYITKGGIGNMRLRAVST